MDISAILMGAIAVGGLVLAAVSIISLARVCHKQADDLAKLAMRKPYWLVETNERGVVQISHLESRVAAIEAGGNGSPGVIPPQQNQWAPADRPVAVGTMPSMNADDEQIEVGERL